MSSFVQQSMSRTCCEAVDGLAREHARHPGVRFAPGTRSVRSGLVGQRRTAEQRCADHCVALRVRVVQIWSSNCG